MSNNIVEAKVSIVGTRPLWFHKFGPDTIALEKKERTGVAGNDPEEWRKTCMVTKTGQLYIQPDYIYGTIRDGAKYTKKGRGSIQTSVAATLQILDDVVLIDRFMPGFPNGHDYNPATEAPPDTNPENDVYVDIRRVRNPANKSSNVRYRVACAKNWRCQFTIAFDKTVVSTSEIKACLNDAGKLCGVGDGRTIGKGRYDVESFEVLKD